MGNYIIEAKIAEVVEKKDSTNIRAVARNGKPILLQVPKDFVNNTEATIAEVKEQGDFANVRAVARNGKPILLQVPKDFMLSTGGKKAAGGNILKLNLEGKKLTILNENLLQGADITILIERKL